MLSLSTNMLYVLDTCLESCGVQVFLREHEFVLVFPAAAHMHGQHLRVREYLLCRGGIGNDTGHIRARFCKMQHVLSQLRGWWRNNMEHSS